MNNVSNTFQRVQPSTATAGRWQIGDGPDAHKLTSGDLVEFFDAGQVRRGRIEHDARGYGVAPTDGGEAVNMAAVNFARFIGSGRL